MRPFERREIAGKLGLKLSPGSMPGSMMSSCLPTASPAQVVLRARQYKFNDTK